MPYRKAPKNLRIPHQVAALAAVVLLVTAWTGRDDDTLQTVVAQDRDHGLITLEAASGGDAQTSDPIAEKRSKRPASLMLFRFN